MILKKHQTERLKGMAAILLLLHHCLFFADRQPYGFELKPMTSLQLQGTPLYMAIGAFGKICIPMFLFLGGYGLAASKLKVDEDHVTLVHGYTKTIVRLYKSYWKVFLIFVPIGLFLVGAQKQYCIDNYICNVFADKSFTNFVTDFFGWTSTYNREWWFLKFYIFSVFSGYVFLEIFKYKKNVYIEIFVVILIGIFNSHIVPHILQTIPNQGLGDNPFFTQFFSFSADKYWNCSMLLMGIVFAKYGILVFWKTLLARWLAYEKKITAVLLIVAVFIFRTSLVGNRFDLFLVPVFLFACHILFDDLPWVCRCLAYVGKNSTNLWLVHSFYCYYIYGMARIVYVSRNPLVSFLTLLGMTLLTCFLLNEFWDGIKKAYQKLREKIQSIAVSNANDVSGQSDATPEEK